MVWIYRCIMICLWCRIHCHQPLRDGHASVSYIPSISIHFYGTSKHPKIVCPSVPPRKTTIWDCIMSGMSQICISHLLVSINLLVLYPIKKCPCKFPGCHISLECPASRRQKPRSDGQSFVTKIWTLTINDGIHQKHNWDIHLRNLSGFYMFLQPQRIMSFWSK